jgi:hypothetical protein
VSDTGSGFVPGGLLLVALALFRRRRLTARDGSRRRRVD